MRSMKTFFLSLALALPAIATATEVTCSMVTLTDRVTIQKAEKGEDITIIATKVAVREESVFLIKCPVSETGTCRVHPIVSGNNMLLQPVLATHAYYTRVQHALLSARGGPDAIDDFERCYDLLIGKTE